MPFSEIEKNKRSFAVIPHNLKDYLALVDWTGRAVRKNKNGFITSTEPKLLSMLGLSIAQWQVQAPGIQMQAITMLMGWIGSERLKNMNN